MERDCGEPGQEIKAKMDVESPAFRVCILEEGTLPWSWGTGGPRAGVQHQGWRAVAQCLQRPWLLTQLDREATGLSRCPPPG